MSSLLRLFLIATLLVVVYVVVMKPSKLGQLGKHARKVAYAYVAAILIGAFMRLAFGWGT